LIRSLHINPSEYAFFFKKREARQKREKKRGERGRQATRKLERAREHRRKNIQFTSTSQLQRLCFVRHLPVAKEAHVSCLSIFGFIFCKQDLQV
jgi:hypothetical protein